MASATTPQKKYRLLVLDGGGMRGIGTLHILRELKRIGLDITDFDMIGGTSAGGLIALATLCGLDLDGIEDLFVAIGKATFTSSWQNTAWHRLQMLESLIRNTTAPGQHRTTDYQETLSAALADRGIDPNSTLRALGEKHRQPKVFAVASDISFISTVNAFIMRSYNHREEESGKTKYFEVYQGTSDISLLTAAISTSAAPTYFDEHVPWKDTFLIDGGIGFNNPIFLAINELKRNFGWDAEVELVVSIGTGLPPKKVSARGKSVLDWSTTVVNLATEGDFIHKNFLLVRPTLSGFGDSIYARFNPPELGGRAMDDPSPKALRKIRKLAEDHMKERIVQSKMREIKELLRQQARPPSSSSSPSSS